MHGGTLELAIGGVLRAEQQIKDNFREVKAQIHSYISRHLECLRSHEVWLDEQVDSSISLKRRGFSSRPNSSTGYWASSTVLFISWSAPKNKRPSRSSLSLPGEIEGSLTSNLKILPVS